MSNNKSLERLRSAGILVNVYPAGQKGGHVKVSVESVGPIELEEDEVLTVLKSAVEMMENGEGSWLDPEEN